MTKPPNDPTAFFYLWESSSPGGSLHDVCQRPNFPRPVVENVGPSKHKSMPSTISSTFLQHTVQHGWALDKTLESIFKSLDTNKSVKHQVHRSSGWCGIAGLDLSRFALLAQEELTSGFSCHGCCVYKVVAMETQDSRLKISTLRCHRWECSFEAADGRNSRHYGFSVATFGVD